MLGLVLRITQKMEIAEEVVSDVYLQVWRQADRFDSTRGNALAWLTVLCRSRALDTVRKNVTNASYVATPIGELPEPASNEFLQDVLLATEQHSALYAALDTLKPEQRQLLSLAYFRGYSHSELSDCTGIPLGTVKTQLRRTLSKLKRLVAASDSQEVE